MMPQNIFYNVSSAQEKLVRITFPYYQDRRWQTNLKSSISEMCVKCIEHCDCALPSHSGFINESVSPVLLILVFC